MSRCKRASCACLGVAVPAGAVPASVQQRPGPAGGRLLGAVLPLGRPQRQDPGRHRLRRLQAPRRAAHVKSGRALRRRLCRGRCDALNT